MCDRGFKGKSQGIKRKDENIHETFCEAIQCQGLVMKRDGRVTHIHNLV